MDEVMIRLFNMSLTAVWLILAVIVLRLILKKAPKYINLIMWTLVGLRLVCPFTFESTLSIVPSAEPIPQDIYSSVIPRVDTGIDSVNQVVNSVIFTARSTPVSVELDDIDYLEAFLDLLPLVWLVGIVILLVYSFICFFMLRRKVKVCIRFKDNIYLCDNIKTPFILGIFRPKIYLPSDIENDEINCVIAHEKSHIARLDHLWKPLGFVILCIHWFNPFVWLAYSLFCRDIEYACDEKTLKKMGTDEKKAYSETLLALSSPKYKMAACPLAFGETGVKGRIKSVLSYKKPALWIIIVAVVALVAVAVGFMTNPVNLLSDGIYYVDEYYMITPRYSENEESMNSALDYGLDKTYFKISGEWFSKTNNNGTFGKYLLMKYTEKQKNAEIEEILKKLPDELAKKRIRSVCGSDTQLFIVFSNGVCVGAGLTKDSDGKYTVNSVFRLSDKPHETLPVTDINPDYLEKNAFTNNEDVEIDIIEVNLDKSPYVEVVINNYTGEDLIFEYPDTVYFYQNGNLIDCDMIENREKNSENSYTVNSYYPCQKKISLEGYDLSKTGVYNMVFGFKLSDSGTEYTAGISFEVVGGIPVDENMSSELKGEG